MSFGTKMPRTSFDIISKYKIALPPIEEQNNILSIFSGVDNQLLAFRYNINKLFQIKKKLLNESLSGELKYSKQ
jgi:type I restriction enzyme S subunit